MIALGSANRANKAADTPPMKKNLTVNSCPYFDATVDIEIIYAKSPRTIGHTDQRKPHIHACQ